MEYANMRGNCWRLMRSCHILRILCIDGRHCQTIVQVTNPIQHSEAPHWDHKTQVLYFVDTFAPQVLCWNSKTQQTASQTLDGDSVGFIVPVRHLRRGLVVCRDRKVDLLSWDGVRNDSGTLRSLASVDENKPHNQFNDGKADAKGRLWGGTLWRNEDNSVTSHGGSLYHIKSSKPEEVLSNVSISNGLAWSKDNTKFFYIDSETRKIVEYKFNPTEGTIKSPRTLFDLEWHPTLQGIPDGMTIDQDDNLWVALYGGRSVIKVSSSSGALLQVVPMPATYVTSVAFGGAHLNVLFVTTSKMKLTPEEAVLEPLAGSVFAVGELGARGLPANDFRLLKSLKGSNEHDQKCTLDNTRLFKKLKLIHCIYK